MSPTMYHYTRIERLPSIIADGFLRPCESNVGSPPSRPFGPPHGEHVAPDVVWVTQKCDAIRDVFGIAPKSYVGDVMDFYGARFAFDLPADEVHQWERWAKDHGINRLWMNKLSRDCDKFFTYCVARPILDSEWTEVGLRRPDGTYAPLDADVIAAIGTVPPLRSETREDARGITGRYATEDELERIRRAIQELLPPAS